VPEISFIIQSSTLAGSIEVVNLYLPPCQPSIRSLNNVIVTALTVISSKSFKGSDLLSRPRLSFASENRWRESGLEFRCKSKTA
jgi:hypothetical protein